MIPQPDDAVPPPSHPSERQSPGWGGVSMPGDPEREAPRRTVVTAPRTCGTTLLWEDDSECSGGEPVRALIRAQLRAALGTCGLVAIVMVGLPLLPALAPQLSSVRPYGAPLLWMGLAFAAQPVWIFLGIWHARRSERIEREHDPSASCRRPGDGIGPGLPAPRGRAARRDGWSAEVPGGPAPASPRDLP